MKGMEKIAVAQEKADHFCAPLENPAGLRIRAESQTPDALKYARTCFPAHLRARIQHAGNRSDADGSGLCNLANRCFSWNCFHDGTALCRSGACGKKLENRCVPLVPRDSDLTGGFRSDRVWNQFQWFRWFVCTGASVFSNRVGCDVMKKLFGSSFPWIRGMNNSHAMNSEEFAAPATAGLVKRWGLSMAALLAAILLGFSAPVMGQAVNATLLGTVTDSSGAAVSNAKVTITE